MDNLLHDVRAAFRAVVVQPLPTLLAFLSLTVVIALLTAAVGLGDRALIRTLPAADAHELVIPRWHAGTEFPAESLLGSVSFDDAGRSSSTSFPIAAWRRFADAEGSIDNLVAFSSIDRINAAVDGRSFVATGHSVSGNYFACFEIRAAAGRL